MPSPPLHDILSGCEVQGSDRHEVLLDQGFATTFSISVGFVGLFFFHILCLEINFPLRAGGLGSILLHGNVYKSYCLSYCANDPAAQFQRWAWSEPFHSGIRLKSLSRLFNI